MPLASRFFAKVPGKSQNIAASLSTEQPVFIDIANGEDSCFPSFSAGIIDNVVTRPKTNQALAATVLSRFTDYFVLPQMSGHILTQTQRFEKMLAKPQIIAQFIHDLSYTLKQIAVDELCKNPEKYDGFFNSREGLQSLSLMREPGATVSTHASEYAIAALADALKIPVIVYVTETGKELPLQHNWGPDLPRASFDSIILLQQSNQYLVHVKKMDRFRAASHQAFHFSMPLDRKPSVDIDMNVILQRVKAENRHLLAAFEQNVHRLTAMVDAGELGKQELLDLYVKEMGIKDENHSQHQVKKAGIAHGSQKFFDDLFDKNRLKRNARSFSAGESHDQRVIRELVCAFARDISLGRLDENTVFAHLEQLEPRRNLL